MCPAAPLAAALARVDSTGLLTIPLDQITLICPATRMSRTAGSGDDIPRIAAAVDTARDCGASIVVRCGRPAGSPRPQ